MLYMMMDARGNDTLIKVGRTKNLNKRLNSYRTHNPLAKLVATFDSPSWDTLTENILEKDCHDFFEYKCDYKRVAETEWFYVPKGNHKQMWRKQGFEPIFEKMIEHASDDILHVVAKVDNKSGRKRKSATK